MKQTNFKRGDIYWGDFDLARGSETKKIRPSIIVSHDLLNQYSLRVTVAPITSQIKKIYWWDYPIKVKGKDAKIMFDQLRVFDKSRLGSFIEHVSLPELKEIDAVIKKALGLTY